MQMQHGDNLYIQKMGPVTDTERERARQVLHAVGDRGLPARFSHFCLEIEKILKYCRAHSFTGACKVYAVRIA
jgi:hypothetical protein